MKKNKNFGRILNYVKPYWVGVLLNIVFNLLAIVFSLVSFSMIVPFLNLLFNPENLTLVKPDFALDTDSLLAMLDYLISYIIVTKGQATALIFICLLLVLAFFMRNLTTYLALYFMVGVRADTIKDLRSDLYKKIMVLSRGYINELSFSMGANVNDKVFVGASIGIPFLYRSLLTEYQENDLDNNNNFQEWEQRETLYTDGCGINAKIGVIVFPARWVRLGLSLTTPTSYYVDESWKTSTYADFKTNKYVYNSDISFYSYHIKTPMLINASTAFIFGNFGMITADYEYVNYRTIRVSSSDYDYSNLNGDISQRFKPTSNLRFGTEWRLKRMCFRGGYSIYGSPYGFSKNDLRTDTYSIGLGYTFGHVTIDAAYALSNTSKTYDMYSAYTLYPAHCFDGSIDNTEIKETTNINQLIVSIKIRLD